MILADTGFWLALANRSDPWAGRSAQALRTWSEEGFISTWPVITEACHLLAARLGNHAVLKFVGDLEQGACEIAEMPDGTASRVRKLMQKYASLPMDLADASLVILAEELEEERIVSTDERDFGTYRWKNHKPFKNLLIEG